MPGPHWQQGRRSGWWHLSLFIWGCFLSEGSFFLPICFAWISLTKDQFLQLVGDASGAPRFGGWLFGSGVLAPCEFSGGWHVRSSVQEWNRAVFGAKGLFSRIVLCACMLLPVLSRALPMPIYTVLVWAQVSHRGDWSRLCLRTGEKAESWLLHP